MCVVPIATRRLTSADGTIWAEPLDKEGFRLFFLRKLTAHIQGV